MLGFCSCLRCARTCCSMYVLAFCVRLRRLLLKSDKRTFWLFLGCFCVSKYQNFCISADAGRIWPRVRLTGESIVWVSCGARCFVSGKHSDVRTLSVVLLYVGRGGTSILQGGAIYATSGVNMEISACTFQQNEADYVSADCEDV